MTSAGIAGNGDACRPPSSNAARRAVDLASLDVACGDDDRATSSAAMSDRGAAARAKTGDGGSLTTYAGGKNGAGVWQRIISAMPPHTTYVEAFLGSGAVMRRKRPASRNVGIDADAGVIAAHGDAGPGCELIVGDAVAWMREHTWEPGTLVYCDPPYLGSTRSGRSHYRCELLSDEEHSSLLDVLTGLPAMVILSGYRSALYDAALATWRRVDFTGMTRGGPRAESLWMNFPEPTELHDYRYLGEDFHDRCRLRRKLDRWTRKLAALPVLERAAILDALGVGAARAHDGAWISAGEYWELQERFANFVKFARKKGITV